MSNAIIKATAATAAAATLLGVGVTPAFANQTATPDGGQGQNQTQPTAHERLAAAIKAADAKAAQDRDWDRESKDAFDKAYAAAKAVGDDASDQDAATAASALETATDGLESAAEKALDDAKAQAEALKSKKSDYTEASWKGVEDALADAGALKATDDRNGDLDRQSKADAITAAIGALVRPSAERLGNAIKAADIKAAQDRDWTDASKSAFDKAYSAAKAVADDDDARDKAADALEKATTALTTTQRTTLAAAVKDAKAVIADGTRYTQASLKALSDAADAGSADLPDDKAGDARAVELTEAIGTARKGLKSTAQDGLEKAVARYGEAEASDRNWTKDTWSAIRRPYATASGLVGKPDIAANDDAKRKATEALGKALDGLRTDEQEAYDRSLADGTERAKDVRYTKASRDDLQTVLDGNKGLAATDKAGDERLASATEAINEAIGKTVRVSRDNLNRAIEAADAKAAQSRDWDKDSKTTFDAKREAAGKAAVDADDATLDSLAADLRVATADLTTVQRAGYTKTVKDAEAMAEDGRYTAEWIDALKAELQKQGEKVKAAGDDKAGDDLYAKATQDINAFVSDPSYNTEQSLTEALVSAEKQTARGLHYSGDATAKAAFDKAYKDAGDAAHKDKAAQDKARDALNQAQAALFGKSDEERAYKAAADKAAGLTHDAYDNYDTVEALLGYDTSGRSGAEIGNRTAAIDAAVKALVANRWTVGGQALVRRDGKWTSGDPVGLGSKPDGLQAIGPDGLKVDLTSGGETFVQDGETLGVGHMSGTLAGSGHHAAFDVGYTYKAGSETTVKEASNARFALKDGRWTASVSIRHLGVDKDGKALDDLTEAGDLSDVELSDGTRLVHGAESAVRETPNPEEAGLTVLSRDVEYAGRTAAGADVSLTVTYTTTWGQTIEDLGLSYRLPGGSAVPVTVAGLPTTVDALPSSITLPAQPASLKDAEWTISPKTTGDVRFDLSSPSVQADGTRIYRVTIHYYRKADDGSYKAATKAVRVTVPFQSAPKVVGNDKAALKGFTVNGKALEGYSKDVVDYTIHAGADEKVLVAPVPEDGQDVRAGDSRQTAYTTTQWWTVSKDGESRTYSVTLVRDHTTPTAAEAFKPADPAGSQTKDVNPSADNTALRSVGYTLDGVYHPADGPALTIPEGGRLAYEYYEGQTVDVSSTRTDGMTWAYSLGVLSADGSRYEVHDVTVTYLTAATHRAELTGIKADGRLVSGFDPKRLEYTVKVGNADRYVITPVFDKTTGMSVTVHKDGRTVTLTVTSADGLVGTVYTVHVESDAALAALSSTGKGVGPAAAIAALLAMLGIGVGVASRRREM